MIVKFHQVVRTQQRPAAELDVIVGLPDGTHAALAVSCTDYLVPQPGIPAPDGPPLLDLEGLRRLAQFVASFRPPPP